jgi:hypothetical protein
MGVKEAMPPWLLDPRWPAVKSYIEAHARKGLLCRIDNVLRQSQPWCHMGLEEIYLSPRWERSATPNLGQKGWQALLEAIEQVVREVPLCEQCRERVRAAAESIGRP